MDENIEVGGKFDKTWEQNKNEEIKRIVTEFATKILLDPWSLNRKVRRNFGIQVTMQLESNIYQLNTF